MPQVTLNISVEYIAYLCDRYGYDTQKLENEGQGAFAKRKLIEQEKNGYKAYQMNKRAADAAKVLQTDEITIS